jgi:hypothetical protein
MRGVGQGHQPGHAWGAAAEPDRHGVPVAGAPGWHVAPRSGSPTHTPGDAAAVERPKQRADEVDPQPAPDPRAQTLVPLVAGVALSVLVLGLAFFDQGWLDRLTGGSGPSSEPAVVVGTIEDLTSQPEAAPQAVAPEPRPAEPAAQPAGAAVATGGPDHASAPAEQRAPLRIEPLPVEPLPSAAPPPATASASVGPAEPAGPVVRARTPPIPVPRPATLAQERGARAPEGAGAVPAGIVQAAYGEAAEPAGAPVAQPGIRVFIHYTVGREDAEVARRLAAFLELRGFTVADLRPVSFPIDKAGLRYFFDRDRDESWRLFEEIDWFFGSMPERAPVRAADFTHYTPRPRPGNVEVWLPTS